MAFARKVMNKPADLQLDTVPFWIGGKPVSSAQRYGDVFNPATGQVTKRVAFLKEKPALYRKIGNQLEATLCWKR